VWRFCLAYGGLYPLQPTSVLQEQVQFPRYARVPRPFPERKHSVGDRRQHRDCGAVHALASARDCGVHPHRRADWSLRAGLGGRSGRHQVAGRVGRSAAAVLVGGRVLHRQVVPVAPLCTAGGDCTGWADRADLRGRVGTAGLLAGAVARAGDDYQPQQHGGRREDSQAARGVRQHARAVRRRRAAVSGHYGARVYGNPAVPAAVAGAGRVGGGRETAVHGAGHWRDLSAGAGGRACGAALDRGVRHARDSRAGVAVCGAADELYHAVAGALACAGRVHRGHHHLRDALQPPNHRQHHAVPRQFPCAVFHLGRHAGGLILLAGELWRGRGVDAVADGVEVPDCAGDCAGAAASTAGGAAGGRRRWRTSASSRSC
jgi:hypothetical protein